MNSILIVDDRDDNRYLLESLLKGAGYIAKAVANGEEAIEALENEKFQMVISDILMPVMDGFQLCRKVRSEEKFKPLIFIIYTATYTGPQDEEFALKIGADRFVQKPCEPEVLLEIVREMFERHASGLSGREDKDVPQEEEVLKLYNERLIKKLEQKMLQAEMEIAARIRAEESLNVINSRLNMALDTSGIGLWDYNMQTGEIWFSRQWKEILGYREDEIADKSSEWEERIHPDDKKRVLGHVENYFEGKLPDYDIEYRMLHRDGSYRWIAAKGGVISDDAAGTRNFLGGHIDITEKKELEKNRKELEIQLYQAQKMESVGLLAGGVAHDFNNLLTIILNYTEILLDEKDNNDPDFSALEEVYQAAERATVLTRQLLAFSRKQVLNIIIADINTIITEFEKFMRRIVREDINLYMKLSEKKLTVEVDVAQFEQVLMNLIVNAKDAMPEGGKLAIETELLELDETYPGKKHRVRPGQYVMVGVSDTGCGMTEDVLEHIFEPFFTTKEKGKGTGLGLATVYGIIRQLGGDVQVYSEPGRGTSFKIYLPLCEKDAGIQEKRARNVVKIKGTATILIVEDDRNVLALTSSILTKQGYEIMTANSTEDAINMAAGIKKPIHLLISDVVMPGMKGPEVFNRIHVLHPETRVLYMSGYTNEMVSRHELLEKGIEFLQKPFNVNALCEKVADILGMERG